MSRAAGGPEMTRLLERHKREKRAFEGRIDAEHKSHTDDLDDELKHLNTSIRVAKDILRDRYNFNVRAVDKGMDMLNVLPSLPIQNPMPKERPQTPNWSGTPAKNIKSRSRSRQSSAMSREGKNRPASGSRTPARSRQDKAEVRIETPTQGRPPSAAGSGKEEEEVPWRAVEEGDEAYTGVPCDWCTKMKASVEYYIPCGDNRKCGHFCDWMCAKAWNQTRSPVQFRFIRDIRIDTLAKESVEPACLAWGKRTQQAQTQQQQAETPQGD